MMNNNYNNKFTDIIRYNSRDGNHNKKSRSIKRSNKDREYDTHIVLVKTQNDIMNFIKICNGRWEELKKNDVYACIDFEFNMNWKLKERYISLMQIMFVGNDYDLNYKTVYVLNPLKFKTKFREKLIDYVFCSNMIKILHGSDSLDIPHIYRSLFRSNKDRLIKFINYTIDTRFICELIKNIDRRLGKDVDNRCSIYNALFYNDVIDQTIYDRLEKISSKINYNKNWFVDKLTVNQLEYSINDVLYLFDLLQSMVSKFSGGEIEIISLVSRTYRFRMLNDIHLIC